VTKLDPSERAKVVRYEGKFCDKPSRDTWYAVMASGDEAPVPVQHKTALPLGFTNVFRFDADGDGLFTPLREHARRLVAAALTAGELPASLAAETPSFRRQAVGAVGDLAARGANGDQVVRLLSALARDSDPKVRGGAFELLSRRPEKSALLALLNARSRAADGLERARLDFELVRAGHLQAILDWKPAYDASKGLDRHSMRRDLLELVRTRPISGWKTAGPYPARTWEEGLSAEWPPEMEVTSAGAIRWRPTGTDKRCQLNFRDTMDPREHAVAYARVSLRAAAPLETALLVESQSAIRVLLDGVEVYCQKPRKDSETRLEIVPVSLRAGEQSLLVKSAVERGSWGFVLHIVDPLGRVSRG